MWSTEHKSHETLSHDRPCPYCGHAAHRYLPCDRNCDCSGSLGQDQRIIRTR